MAKKNVHKDKSTDADIEMNVRSYYHYHGNGLDDQDKWMPYTCFTSWLLSLLIREKK